MMERVVSWELRVMTLVSLKEAQVSRRRRQLELNLNLQVLFRQLKQLEWVHSQVESRLWLVDHNLLDQSLSFEPGWEPQRGAELDVGLQVGYE